MALRSMKFCAKLGGLFALVLLADRSGYAAQMAMGKIMHEFKARSQQRIYPIFQGSVHADRQCEFEAPWRFTAGRGLRLWG